MTPGTEAARAVAPNGAGMAGRGPPAWAGGAQAQAAPAPPGVPCPMSGAARASARGERADGSGGVARAAGPAPRRRRSGCERCDYSPGAAGIGAVTWRTQAAHPPPSSGLSRATAGVEHCTRRRAHRHADSTADPWPARDCLHRRRRSDVALDPAGLGASRSGRSASGVRRHTGESSHRSSRFQATTSMPLDHRPGPGRHPDQPPSVPHVCQGRSKSGPPTPVEKQPTGV